MLRMVKQKGISQEKKKKKNCAKTWSSFSVCLCHAGVRRCSSCILTQCCHKARVYSNVLTATQATVVSITHCVLMIITTMCNRCCHSLTSLWPQNETHYTVYKERNAGKPLIQLPEEKERSQCETGSIYLMIVKVMTASYLGHAISNSTWMRKGQSWYSLISHQHVFRPKISNKKYTFSME